MLPENLKAELAKIAQQPQRQDGALEQLKDLHAFANRLGLYDAFLIKENHIASLGSITAVITQARGIAANRKVEIEVESLAQLQEAIDAGADIVMLDNFSLEQMHQAVQLTAGRLKLEASGGMTAEQLRAVAATGVDYISLGTLTKDIKAVDLSMRFTL